MAQRLSTLCEVNWVDGICGSEQIGTVKTKGVKNAGVDISAQCGKGGQCGSGQIGTVCQGYTRIFTANQTDFAAVVECPCCGFRRDCSILWRCLINRLCRILVCAVVIVIGVSPKMLIQRCGVGPRTASVCRLVFFPVLWMTSWLHIIVAMNRRREDL